MEEINILIVDDHNLIRHGIRMLLESQDELKLTVKETETAERAVELIREHDYHIVFMDIKLPSKDGLWATNQIHKTCPGTKVIIVSGYNSHEYVTSAMQAGASGYLLKNTGKTELLKAITNVLDGRKYYCSEVANNIIENMDDNPVRKGNRSMSASLSGRELQILQMIADEYTNDQIAEMLNLSKRTVDAHRQNIIEKTGCKNTAGLIKYGIKHRLIR